MARRLATVERIAALAEIPGADLILRARIRGWDVVVRRDEFAVGDDCVYFEIDSLLDVTDPRFAFLAPRGVRTDVDGRSGHVLRTAKLRGVYSQGLALPLAAFGELTGARTGDDVTEALGVRVFEAPIPAELSGAVRGLRPGWIPMTDEERIQNVPEMLAAHVAWQATEKVDGSSTSVYVDVEGIEGVCSRNLDLLPSDTSTQWNLARRLDLHGRLASAFAGRAAVVQGETFGEGVQGNPLRMRGHHFRAFTLRVDGSEVPRGSWPAELLELSVPVHELAFPSSVDEALAQADRLDSRVTPGRRAEGVVWRAADVADVVTEVGPRRASFKVISNGYLLKHDR